MPREYNDSMRLTPDTVVADPIDQFRSWYAEARAANVRQPEAMTVATAAPDGGVSARTILLRGLDDRGFVFYTNLESDKARDLAAHPRAALVFHWREIERQLRVRGPGERVGGDAAGRDWAAGPRGPRAPPKPACMGRRHRGATALALGRHRRAPSSTPRASPRACARSKRALPAS